MQLFKFINNKERNRRVYGKAAHLSRVSFYASVIFIFTYERRNINNKQV